MAINHRRGKIGDFDPNKMTTAEWAFPDDGTARYCVAPGNVKTVATKEELQEILTSSPEAYQALLQLINNLEDNPSELTNILNNISSLQDNVGDLSLLTTETKTNLVSAINEIMDGKFNISDLVHTDTISDMKKAPSTVVTEAHGREIDVLTNNLATQYYKVYSSNNSTAFIPNALISIFGDWLLAYQRMHVLLLTITDSSGKYFTGICNYKHENTAVVTKLAGTIEVYLNTVGFVSITGGTSPYTITASLLSSK